MNETNLQIVNLPIDSLTPYEKNARQHREHDLAIIKNSIQEFGMCDPIGVWGEKNIIVEGHGRLMALKELGYKEVPCIRLDHLTDEQRKAYALAHNRSAEMSDWDMDTLLEELKALEDDFKLEDLGFDEFLEKEYTDVKEDDFNPEDFINEEPQTKAGDIYVLGSHRLMCGDSTSDDVKTLMGERKADMVFTDPPYGLDYSGGRTQVVSKKEYGKLQNDNLKGQELGHLICNVFKAAKGESDVYICVSPIIQKPFLDYIETVANKKLDAVIVWDKKRPGLGYMAYRRQCEFIYFIKGKPFKKGDKSDFDLWSIACDNAEDYVHGTQKPIELPSRAIENSSKKDDLVLDLFGGSGSTLIACEQLDRQCYMMEIDPKYVDVIVKRYIRFKGDTSDCYLLRNGEKVDLPKEFSNVIK